MPITIVHEADVLLQTFGKLICPFQQSQYSFAAQCVWWLSTLVGLQPALQDYLEYQWFPSEVNIAPVCKTRQQRSSTIYSTLFPNISDTVEREISATPQHSKGSTSSTSPFYDQEYTWEHTSYTWEHCQCSLGNIQSCTLGERYRVKLGVYLRLCSGVCLRASWELVWDYTVKQAGNVSSSAIRSVPQSVRRSGLESFSRAG